MAKEKAKSKVKQITVKEGRITLESMKYYIIGFSAIVAILFLYLYINSAPTSDTGTLSISKATQRYLALAVIFAVGPYGIYSSYMDKRTTRLERRFAEFLRELAEYWRIGLSMSTAISTIAKGDYGVFDKDIRRMSSQISWGIAFNDVLHQLSERIKTQLVIRSVSLIEEANRAGGKIADVLTTAAEDAQEIKWLEKEREKGVKMYVAVIYISFMVYLVVIAILVAVFLPAIIDSSASMANSEDGMGGMGLSVQELNQAKLTFIFFASIIIQSIGNGLMTGVMATGKITSGLKHVLIMLTIGWITFEVMNYVWQIGF